MANLILRTATNPGDVTKNAPLTNAEVDSNFINLDKELGQIRELVEDQAPDVVQVVTNKTIDFDENTLIGVAPLDSPAMTGAPTAPTAPVGTDTTQVATTAYVVAERSAVATLTNKTLIDATLSSPTLTGATLSGTTTLLGALNEAATVTVASAATVNLGEVAANSVIITGTTTITSFGAAPVGSRRLVVFAGDLTLTHSGHLVLPGAKNVKVKAGDAAEFLRTSTGWKCTNFQSGAGIGGSGAVIITGNTTPHVLSETVYTIVNYSSFVEYVVSASAGTISRSGASIAFTAPASAQTVTITVTADDVDSQFEITILANAVLAPTVSVVGAPSMVTETPTISTSAFAVATGADTHVSTTWRVRKASDNSVVWQSISNTTDKLSIVVPAGTLVVSTAYVFEASHTGALLGAGAVGATSANTAPTFSSFVPTPAETPATFGAALEGGFYAGMIWKQVTQSASSKAIGTGSQVFTVAANMTDSPLFYSGQLVEVRSRANPANRFQGAVTSAVGTSLTVDVASITGAGTFGDWSIMARHRVIVAPKSLGENASLALKNDNTAFPAGCQTLVDGLGSTDAMKNAGSSVVYPAAYWARGLTISGMTDWYIPARDELELIWRNLKPTTDVNRTDRAGASAFNYTVNGEFGDAAGDSAKCGVNNNSVPVGAQYTAGAPVQTSALAFRTGGAEALEFGSAYYWSSSEYNATFAWYLHSNSGDAGTQHYDGKTLAFRVRAVRQSII